MSTSSPRKQMWPPSAWDPVQQIGLAIMAVGLLNIVLGILLIFHV